MEGVIDIPRPRFQQSLTEHVTRFQQSPQQLLFDICLPRFQAGATNRIPVVQHQRAANYSQLHPLYRCIVAGLAITMFALHAVTLGTQF
jgi:hypothetical protein